MEKRLREKNMVYIKWLIYAIRRNKISEKLDVCEVLSYSCV